MSVYMRLEEDDSEGGRLEICRLSDDPRFQEVTAPDPAVEFFDPVMDQANTLISMINWPWALGQIGVDRNCPRDPFNHVNPR